MLVPTGVALDTVDEDNPAARGAASGVIAVMTAIAVAGSIGPQCENRVGIRVTQRMSPFAEERFPWQGCPGEPLTPEYPATQGFPFSLYTPSSSRATTADLLEHIIWVILF